VPAVVVDPQHRERRRDRLQVAVADEAEVAHAREVLQHVGRVAAEQHRVEEVPLARPSMRRAASRSASLVAGGGDRVQVERDAHLRAAGGELAGGQAVREHQVVRRRQRLGGLGAARCVVAGGVPRNAEHQGSLNVVQR
jgi:hypothetical protein